VDGPVLVYGLALTIVAFWLVNPTAFVTEDAYFYLVSARRSGRLPSGNDHPLARGG